MQKPCFSSKQEYSLNLLQSEAWAKEKSEISQTSYTDSANMSESHITGLDVVYCYS